VAWVALAPRRVRVSPARPVLRLVKADPYPPLEPTPPEALSSVAQWEKLIGIAEAAAPKLAVALEDAFSWYGLPSSVQQALVQGQAGLAMADLTDFATQQMDAKYVPVFADLALDLFQQVADAQWPALRQVLLATEVPAELPTKFPGDIMNPRAQAYVRTEGLNRAVNLWKPTAEAARTIIQTGLADGTTTQQIARNLRQVIGLLPGQGKQLMTYNQGLIEAGTPPAKIDTLTDKFAAKLLRRRTMTIARTETNAALNVAADTFFEAARAQANLAPDSLRRFWLITYDGRTCFCAGTMVTTPEGEKPIEALLPGDVVCTSEGQRKLLATMSRPFSGMLCVVHTTDDRLVVLTHDHPVWVNGEWSDAETLRPGDCLQAFDHKPLQVASLIQFALQDPDNRPAVRGEPVRALDLFGPVSMPIVPINFQGNAWLTQGEVNTVTANLVFLTEGNVQHGQHLSHDPFWCGLPVEGSITTERTKLPIARAWQTTERDAARATVDHLGRSPADFRTIDSVPLPLPCKCCATSFTRDIDSFFSTTGDGTGGIACGHRGDDGEQRETHRTRFRDQVVCSDSEITRPRTPVSLSTSFGGRGHAKRLPAVFTGQIFWSQPHTSETLSRTIGAGATSPVSPREFLSTVCTIVGERHRAYLQKIVDEYSINYSIPVYDIETEAPHNFYAAHFLVHNCPICRAIPSMNEDGHLFQEPFATPNGPQQRPPSHPNCRCVVIVRPAIIATPHLMPPPGAPTPVVFPVPEPFPAPEPTPPPLPPPPKVKKPKAPKKPTVPEAPPTPVSQSWDASSAAPAWATDPPPAFWAKTADVDVGPTPKMPMGKVSTGVVMIEDGKVWVYEPKHHYGGYTTAFPKGQIETGLSAQQNALKEVFEETGLRAKITGFLGGFAATSGTTRLYVGQKVGGNPTKFADETWSVKLLTPADLEQALVAQNQSYPLQALQALKDKGLIPAGTGPAPTIPPLVPVPGPPLPPTPPTLQGMPTPAPPAPAPPAPVKPKPPPPTITQDVVKGEFVQKLGGSTGAELWRGTDGKLRAIKGPARDQAYQEFLANKLYAELGVDAPEQQLVMHEGKIAGVASAWVEGTQTLGRAGVTQERARQVLKGFVADVWLANRDAIGLDADNILIAGTRTIRIDNGGALQYRAQGSKKPNEWLSKIDEWQGFQSPSANRHYANLFKESGYHTPEGMPDLKAQVQALVDLRERTNGFADLVPAAKGITAKQRKDLVTLLQKRARLLEEQVGLVSGSQDVAVKTAALKQYLANPYNHYAREVMQRKVPPEMHEYEAVAVYAYTGSYSTRMNEPFWTERDAATRARERQSRAPLIEAAVSALPKLKAGDPQKTYYRGVDYISDPHLAQHVKGNVITLEGFASTSLNRTTANVTFGHKQYLYTIKSHGGNYDVRPLSAMGVGSSEQEFLYPPDIKFRIVDIVQEPDVKHPVYYIEEVPEMNKRRPYGPPQRDVAKAEDGTGEDYEGDTWPEGHEQWTHEDYVAHAKAMQARDEAHVYTAEELEVARHLKDKMASASSMNQPDPNAPSESD
jgi:8-oxo-dGTP pyrophosphatase MutT (NUDIX family)